MTAEDSKMPDYWSVEWTNTDGSNDGREYSTVEEAEAAFARVCKYSDTKSCLLAAIYPTGVEELKFWQKLIARSNQS